ncbi:hypothetical protein DF16_pBMB69orf00048 (plasmid) [Bacillus thuringiensis serovar kurstaki str. YBT-1520]|nr:hypothetical protein DF16_pBMB69orf00048 [Bacillus thuringiensis serovar kurstaki str. YBT-1520]
MLEIADVLQSLLFHNVEKIYFRNSTAFLSKRLLSPSGLIRVPVAACNWLHNRTRESLAVL